MSQDVGPRFERLVGEIVQTTKGPALRLDRPHLVLQLSAAAARVLGALPGTIDEIAAQTNVAPAKVASILRTFESRRLVTRRGATEPRRWPSVSIVIPAHGRPEATLATVSSARALAYRGEVEILVVDDASPVPLDLGESPVRLLRHPTNRGPSSARNTGLHAADGEIVGFLDNDCTADPRWLAILVAALEEPGVDVAGGRAIAPVATGTVAAYEAARSPLDMGPLRSAVGLGENVPYIPTCNLAVRRSTALALGGFREGMHLGEDVDFIWRAQPTSRIVYEPSAMVVHHHRERLGPMLYRRAQYASSEALLARLHPAGARTLVVPVTVGLGLAALTVSRFSLIPALAALVLFALEVRSKRAKLRAIGLAEGRVTAAVLRAHGAALFHFSAALSRYSGIALMALAILIPRTAPAALVLLFTYPVVDRRVRRAKVSLLDYVGLYTLEMIAYQIGVTWGRVRHRSVSIPKVRFRR